MSTSRLVFTTHIGGIPELIFDLVADMPNYGRWLPGSEAFGGTTEVTPYPVRLGTTYMDAGPLGKRPGYVEAFDRPNRIAFRHTMLLKRGPLSANLDFHVAYELQPQGESTLVIRTLDLTIQTRALFRFMHPLIVHGTRKENVRTLAALKRYVEAHTSKSLS